MEIFCPGSIRSGPSSRTPASDRSLTRDDIERSWPDASCQYTTASTFTVSREIFLLRWFIILSLYPSLNTARRVRLYQTAVPMENDWWGAVRCYHPAASDTHGRPGLKVEFDCGNENERILPGCAECAWIGEGAATPRAPTRLIAIGSAKTS